MKKLVKMIIILMMVPGLLLVGCQSDLDKTALIGRYEVESINGKSPQEGVESYLEILDEENYTLVYNGNGYSFDFPSTYRVKGNKLFLSGFYDGKGNATEQECIVDGDIIKYTELQTEYKYVFKK